MMIKSLNHLGVVLAVAAGLLLAVGMPVVAAVSPAEAAFPGHNGRIAFMRQDAHGFWQTWVSNKDLSKRMKLTSKSADSG